GGQGSSCVSVFLCFSFSHAVLIALCAACLPAQYPEILGPKQRTRGGARQRSWVSCFLFLPQPFQHLSYRPALSWQISSSRSSCRYRRSPSVGRFSNPLTSSP